MATREKSETFTFRVSPAFMRMIDEWRRQQPDIPTRAEAVRRLVISGLTVDENLLVEALRYSIAHLDRAHVVYQDETDGFRSALLESQRRFEAMKPLLDAAGGDWRSVFEVVEAANRELDSHNTPPSDT